MAAVLHQYRHGHLGVVGRGVGHEPGVILHPPGLLLFGIILIQGDYLGRAGFAGHLDVGQAGGLARAIVDHPHQRLAHHLQIGRAGPQAGLHLGLGLKENLPGRAFHLLHDIGFIDGAAIGDGCHHPGHLDGSGQIVTLADGYRDRIAFVPGLMESSLFPGQGSHQARHLLVQIEAGGRAQAEAPAPLGDAFNAQAPAHLVEIDVAGMHYGPVEVHGAVAALAPAVKHVIAHGQGAAAVDDGAGGDDVFLQAGHCHDDFKGGPRGILALQGAVFQGVSLIVVDLLPLLGGESPFEGLLGKGGRGRQGQDPAGSGVQGHDGPHLAFQAGLGFPLHPIIQGEGNVGPGRGDDAVQLAQFPPVGVYLDAAGAPPAPEVLFPGQLHPVFAEVISHLIIRELAALELDVADFTQVAQDVAGHALIAIFPLRLDLDEDSGQFRLKGLHPGHFIPSEVGPDPHLVQAGFLAILQLGR